MRNILENGISMWPKYDGRWPVTSGIKFKFDGTREPGNRILPESLLNSEDEPIDLNREYLLASKYYISTGKDGYHAFEDPNIKSLSDHDTAPTVQDI